MFKMWANIQAVILLLITSMLMGAVSAIDNTSGKSCVDSTFLTSVYTNDLIWGRPKIGSDIDLTSLIFDFNRQDFMTTFNPVAGVQNNTRHDFNIAYTYYRYWDSGYQPGNYSFVDFAVTKGYSVLFYDRVGAGQSTVISGYDSQFSIHVDVLQDIIGPAKGGYITPQTRMSPKYVPKKVVLMGHSVGSIATNALVAAQPDIADGIVLSGFYKVPNLDKRAVKYVFDSSWPIAIMEFFSIATSNFASPGVKAPVLFINGEYDYIFCGGYCPGSLEPAARSFLPASIGYESYIQPNTGHILNTAPNTTGTYQAITNFLAKNGL
ncbi:hypothetical protein IFR04_000896 [Cadophora malorum]|uniref:Serine aminopeptidase S33 domain-containing protein n=1 Tax=Cadophora malorum TaxID=108018 RepID=A0A8H7WJI8_9HELO|nr:hypothetical protein IFR04_000896 [Cadophora malorum]